MKAFWIIFVATWVAIGSLIALYMVNKNMPGYSTDSVMEYGASTKNSEPTNTINITDSSFMPSSLKVSLNDTVTWVNKGNSPHQVLSDNAIFASAVLNSNEEYRVTFKDKGIFYYHCALNPSIKGIIKVE